MYLDILVLIIMLDILNYIINRFSNAVELT